MLKVKAHPILEDTARKMGAFHFDGQKMEGYIGEPIAVSLLANGVAAFRYTEKKKQPRGLFCGIGQCSDCVVVVNGVPNVRACVTLLEEGMQVETQRGFGSVGAAW
ncbi:sarcosine oxidase subunit alpha [Spirochaetia bacterium]|nr:sarcosine oxidase subunit alpha [Spirochaetia bacterium]